MMIRTAEEFVAALWAAGIPTPGEVIRACRNGSRTPDFGGGGSGGNDSAGAYELVDVLAEDAEVRRRRGLDARIEVYLASHPPLMEDHEACRAVMMVELAGLNGRSVGEAAERIASAYPSLAEDARAVASLCGMMEAEPPSEPGDRLGKYVLIDRLGAGAFGSVWLAEDTELARSVALKILHEQAGEDAARRVIAEAKSAAALDHPNVVKVHSAGRLPDGRAYIDAQLVADSGERGPVLGVSLDRRAGSPMPAKDAAALVRSVARGVAAAHARGIVHRDIKPANIIVTPGGRAMLADFGLSSLAGSGGGTAGTPAFMSPEQARGEPATPAGDIYALGATLRYLLTGALAVVPSGRSGGSDRDDVLAQVREGKVDPLAGHPGVPTTLARICDKAMSVRAEDRYASAASLAEDLDRYLSRRPTEAGREDRVVRAFLWARRHAALVTIAVAALALVSGVSWRAFVQVGRERDAAREAERVATLKSHESEQNLRAAQEAERLAKRKSAEAERNARIAEGVNRFMQDALLVAQGDNRGRDVTMYDAILEAARRIPLTLDEGSLEDAGVRHVVGRVLGTMAEFGQAEALLRRSLEIREKELGPDSVWTLATRFALAEMLSYAHRTAEADAIATPLEADLSRVEGEYGDLLLSARDLLAQIRLDQGRLDDAEKLVRSNLEARRRGERTSEDQLATGLLQHAKILRARGDREAAAKLFREALEIRERLFSEESSPVAAALNDLGAVLAELGRFEEAEPIQRRSLGVMRARLGDGHINTVTAAHNLAWMLLTKKKSPADALGVIEPFEMPARSQLGDKHEMSIRVTQVLGRSLAAAGRHADAIGPLTDSARRSEQLGVPGLAIDAIASRAAAECFGALGDAEKQAEWKARADDRLKRAREAQGR